MLNTLAFLQGQELWIILIVVLVLFGGKKIPELMRGVGKGVGELQKGIEEGKRTMEKAREDTLAASKEEEKSE
jgi:sec-independent protein translocase protein TatA